MYHNPFEAENMFEYWKEQESKSRKLYIDNCSEAWNKGMAWRTEKFKKYGQYAMFLVACEDKEQSYNSIQEIEPLIQAPNWKDVETKAITILPTLEGKGELKAEVEVWKWVSLAMQNLGNLEPSIVSNPSSSLTTSQSGVLLVFKTVEKLIKAIDEKNNELANSLGLNLDIPLHRVLLQAAVIEA